MITGARRITCVLTALVYLLSPSVHCEKYKLCVVDGRGGFKRSGRYCPILDQPDSKVECILGIDRLDCLRKISKGAADFSVFTAEDLVTATNSEIEILIANELRYTKDIYEYEVVAVVQDSSGIRSKHDLRDKKFCHPGYGYETDWTRILSNYLEASVVTQSCNTKYTITENRIKASSDFFKSACKAGPWVNNQTLDDQLKRKYRNLCALCDNQAQCSTSDKYWGRRGSLFCLTDGAGDISWSRLDDVKVHFGLVPGGNESTPDGYSFLCPDGSIRPVANNNPCVWVVKPWPVIATKRSSAQSVQELMTTLSNVDNFSWQAALLNLIETYRVSITKLEPLDAIESYLSRATGFLSANSFSGCHPPRTIRICTTSNLENAKCSWLRESAAVYGIEPDVDCLKADNTTHCMEAINNNVADVVIVPSDLVATAVREYNLKTLFYETVNDDDKYIAVAVSKSDSNINRLEDTEGLKACFPTFDGVAWNSVMDRLNDKKLLDSCPSISSAATFFGPSCVPGLPPNSPSKLKDICNGNSYDGEFGALRCLVHGDGNVAFVSKNSISSFIQSANENKYGSVKMEDFKVLCEQKSTGCHLSWAPIGQAMVRKNSPELWLTDTYDVFLQLDNLFGKNYKSLTAPFQLFGLFDGKPNILFHDTTVKLRNVPSARNFDNMKRHYEDILQSDTECASSSYMIKPLTVALLLSCLFVIKFY